MNDVDPRDRNLAIVFQNYALYPHMTVAANLSFGLKLRHVPRAEIERRIGQIADLLGIRELLARKPIGRAHVCTPVTTAHLVCRHLLDKKQKLMNEHQNK